MKRNNQDFYKINTEHWWFVRVCMCGDVVGESYFNPSNSSNKFGVFTYIISLNTWQISSKWYYIRKVNEVYVIQVIVYIMLNKSNNKK